MRNTPKLKHYGLVESLQTLLLKFATVMITTLIMFGTGSRVAAADESPPPTATFDGSHAEIQTPEQRDGPQRPDNVGTSVWVPAKYQTRLIRACLEIDDSFSVTCLVQSRDCSDGKDGRLMRVEIASVIDRPIIWRDTGRLMCQYSNAPMKVVKEAPPEFTPADFRRLPIAAAENWIQPRPNTLRGANTNIYADAQSQVFTPTVGRHHFDVHAKPVAYAWTYGDGAGLGPVLDPGNPLPKERWGEKTATSHVYMETGDFPVGLTTYFDGEYSVDGGPWIPIAGQAQVASTPVSISVWRSITHNYADDCVENPQGAGC